MESFIIKLTSTTNALASHRNPSEVHLQIAELTSMLSKKAIQILINGSVFDIRIELRGLHTK